ncbi:MAG TPA: hypothetical protein VE398_04610 [Acidobacteriota bacterium]|nr:hypothetical protein [Acidobacteriota bacterium]
MCGMPDSASWKLPPLILHPFSGVNDAQRLAEGSQTNQLLQDLLPHSDVTAEALRKRILDSRYREIRWLYYIGKDVVRWIEQCLDFARSQDGLRHPDLRFQSFAALLTECPPQAVTEKLRKWGVLDFKKLFSRAIGINTLFAEFPRFDLLSEEFLQDYYSYSDSIFICRQNSTPFLKLDAEIAQFEIFTSGEYSNILERGLLNT